MPSADKRQRKKENARLARERREAAVKRKRRNKLVRNGVIAAAIFAAVIGLTSWLGGGNKNGGSSSASTTSTTAKQLTEFSPDPAKTYTATIKTNLGTIVLALDTKSNPIAAGHFITLARGGIYDGSRWHRIVKDFVIQGGAPGGDPNAKYGHPVVADVPKDHYPVGSVAAAKTGSAPKGSFDSQFFIVTGAQQGSTLPNDYARFGRVQSGMDVVRKIEALKTAANEEPTSKATIDSVTINVQ